MANSHSTALEFLDRWPTFNQSAATFNQSAD
jgi:hypothetical protein